MGDAKAKKAGSYYPAIDTAVEGVQVCEHLKCTAKMMDRVTALRTVHHDVVDEHAAATNRMHTGRTTSGTVQYPSLGSIITRERGAVQSGVPPLQHAGPPQLQPGLPLGPESVRREMSGACHVSPEGARRSRDRRGCSALGS